MPFIDKIVFACMPSVIVRIMGTPPTQLASKYSPALPRFAAASSSCQCFENNSLFAVTMLLMERPSLSQIWSAWVPLLYAGVLSCGVGYTLQIVGQRHIDPTIASLILSLESVISVLTGWALLGQKLTLRELIGCILVFCAIILAQLPQKTEKAQEVPQHS